MKKMKSSHERFPGWARRLAVGLMLAAIWCPTLSWGQAKPRVPLELKAKLADGEAKIGGTFVESLKNRINRSDTFRLSSSGIPRLGFPDRFRRPAGEPLSGRRGRHPDRGHTLERRVQRDFCG